MGKYEPEMTNQADINPRPIYIFKLLSAFHPTKKNCPSGGSASSIATTLHCRRKLAGVFIIATIYRRKFSEPLIRAG